MHSVRETAVAGQFYPAKKEELERTVRFLLDEAGPAEGPAPKALIAPHAGYVYSGPVAAKAYARLRPHAARYTRVVLLGPCHQVAVSGLAASSADAFRTPLGDVFLDKSAFAAVDLPQLRVFDETHRREHSLEVHLPFLQAVLGDFLLVPIVVGDASAEDVAEVLHELWGGPETLIVVSSDLSHYLSYDEARAADQATCKFIEMMDTLHITHNNACGCTPISGLLLEAKRRGLSIETLDLRNSADTAGPADQVVGYGAWMVTSPDAASVQFERPVSTDE